MIGGKLWNIIFEAKNKNVALKNIYFKSSGRVSPYMEINLEELNYLELEKNKINEFSINPYYRYFDIFMSLLDIGKENYKELKEELFNVYCHFLAQLEIRKGMTKVDYYLKFVDEEIKNGAFTYEFSEKFYNLFDKDEQEKIFYLIYYNYLNENNLENFCKGVQQIFVNSIIYDFKENNKEIIIFISNKNNEKNLGKIEILKELFLPLGINVILFWEKHFGLLENDDTMIIDNISIF